MPKTRAPSRSRDWIVAILLSGFLVCGIGKLDAATGESAPAAPTIQDAHQYFESLVAGNRVTALYETHSKNGDILGYESFPVQDYKGTACSSGITLKNGVKIAIDWSVAGKSQISDSTLSILHDHDVQFIFFHMVSVEGGIVVEPANLIPRLNFGINDELSRNRLLKAIDLLASACRPRSKFD